MFKLDDNLLRELGLGDLPAEEKNRMLNHIYETLEMRVGMKLAEQMSNEQLDEFESYIDRNDEAGALKWLETNFPNYKQVVADQLEQLKGEIRTAAPQILAASRANAQAMANQPMSPPAPQPPANPYPNYGQPSPNPYAGPPQYPNQPMPPYQPSPTVDPSQPPTNPPTSPQAPQVPDDQQPPLAA